MCRGNLGVGILSLINSKTAHAIPEAAFRVNQGDAILWEDICKVDGGDWILLPRHLRKRVTLFQEPSSEISREKQSFPFLWEDICKVDWGDWILLPRHLWRRVTLFREPSSKIRREKQSFPFLWEDICKVGEGDWIFLPLYLWRGVIPEAIFKGKEGEPILSLPLRRHL